MDSSSSSSSSSSSYKGGLQGYWKQRGCSVGRRRRSLPQVDLGGGSAARRGSRIIWSWRVKAAPRMSFLPAAGAASPRRLIARVRDAYVRMMLCFARAVPPISTAPRLMTRPPHLKEYDDEKVIVEIYKSLVAAAAVRR